jgi:hypothetical protein
VSVIYLLPLHESLAIINFEFCVQRLRVCHRGRISNTCWEVLRNGNRRNESVEVVTKVEQSEGPEGELIVLAGTETSP